MAIPGVEINPLSRSNTAVVNIVLWCVLAWVLTLVMGWVWPFGVRALMFDPVPANFVFKPWSLVTYIFVHGDFFHLFFNILFFFFIGQILEDMTGRRHIWPLFIGGGIAGAFFYMLVWPFLGLNQAIQLVGASGCVTAVIVGTAVMFPRYTVYLFGIIAIELRWIALFRVVLDLLGASGNNNQGGYLCHLGGAAFGALYMLHTKGNIHIPLVDAMGRWFTTGRGPRKPPRRSARVEINRSAENPKNKVAQAEIDRILDKINESGYDSLTKQEKENLFKAGDQ
jgi:membrane associated rhomboid family serine protease